MTRVRMRRLIVSLAVLLLAEVLADSAAAAKPKRPTRKQRAASVQRLVLHRNLIANGNAEIASDTWAAGWNPGEVVESEIYGHTDGEWDRNKEGAPGGAKRYFRMRIPQGQQTVEAFQVISVLREADAIDRGRIAYNISGWLGGVIDGPGSAMLSIAFVNERRETLAEVTIPDSADVTLPKPEFGIASLAERRAIGVVPIGTRRIAIRLRGMNTRYEGCPNCKSVALADNLSLLLTPETPRP